MSAPAQPEPAPLATRPALRLVVVPTPQPPVVDEPVRWVLPGVRAPRPQHRPGPRPRTPAPIRPDDFGPAWSTRAELPDVRAAGRALVTTALEALAGRRPLAQVQPLTTPGVFTALARGNRPRWCADGTAPLVIGPVHVCEPVDGVAEVSAVARRAGRAHAVAARLEGIDGRWRCTALQIG
jgi:Family of unknown function (DUF6459)